MLIKHKLYWFEHLINVSLAIHAAFALEVETHIHDRMLINNITLIDTLPCINFTCKWCWVRSQDLEQSLTTYNCTNGLSSDPPPYNPPTHTLPDCYQFPQCLGVVGGVEGKT